MANDQGEQLAGIEGYALEGSSAHEDERGQNTHRWVIDPANMWADENALFWEFADLI